MPRAGAGVYVAAYYPLTPSRLLSGRLYAEVLVVKRVALALATILIALALGSALGNPAGGFVAGVVVAIVLAKRSGAADASESA